MISWIFQNSYSSKAGVGSFIAIMRLTKKESPRSSSAHIILNYVISAGKEGGGGAGGANPLDSLLYLADHVTSRIAYSNAKQLDEELQ